VDFVAVHPDASQWGHAMANETPHAHHLCLSQHQRDTIATVCCRQDLHCAESCRPFELFANENCELWNEAKMNVTFERGLAQDLLVQSSLC